MSAVGLRLREPLGARTAGTLGPRAAERPRLRLVVFGVLALLGVLRWRTLMSPAPTVRLLALAGLALLVAETPRLLRDRSRAIRIAVAGAAAVALLPLSGMPLAWLAHLRLAAAVRAIGTGLGALPAVLVPLLGGGPSVRMVITLGAGGLLLASALLLAFAPRPLRGRWLAGVSLPLVVLVVLPGILLAPRLPYLEGLLLFTLLAALAWGDRLRGPQLPVAAALTALAGAAGMLLAPALHPHRPWLEVQSLAAVPSSARPEQFDFAQHLGPLHWPRTGREMFSVLAPRPDLWKVQDLDLFDGRGFVPGVVPADPLPAPDPAALARFTQTITVTISGMQSHSVIAAGDAAPPQGLRAAVSPGLAPGTWTVSSPLHPGSSYRVQTYSPVPSEAELAHAGSAYPAGALAPYRSMLLPSATLPDVSTPILFAPFHDGATAGLRGSPYGRAYALAQRLAGGATPYAFVARVFAFLHRGFTYDEDPPWRRFALESFLFADRRGYCQQFSGAMALLLRMGGLPARVAGGFTTGSADRAARGWRVSDLDAHNWVEVWFPHFGWVRFDPTPASAVARATSVPLPARHERTGSAPRLPAPAAHLPPPPPGRRQTVAAGGRHGAGGLPLWQVLAVVAALLAALGAAAATRRSPLSDEALVAELQRTLRRCGRPAAARLTLAGLEHRLRSDPEAAAYVRAIRLARFAGAPARPTEAQRRALRVQLRAGLGLTGWMRALWALPPRPRRGRRVRLRIH